MDHIHSVSCVRTDTTIDLSQEAEKVWLSGELPPTQHACVLLPALAAALRGWQQRERMLPQTEIVLWTTPKGPPKASQASECSELLDLTRAAYLIAAQRQPGKFSSPAGRQVPNVLQSCYPRWRTCLPVALRRQKIAEIASMRPEHGNV
jgi:hypothetical protein